MGWNKDGRVRTRLAIKIHALLESRFPERRLFLKSDTDTRFIRLRPLTQLVAYAGASVIVAWSIVATAILLMDSIGSGNFRDQARRDQQNYQARLNVLSVERDSRAVEALAAQARFAAALDQVSIMQSELLSSETRRLELETGIEVIQSTLRDTMKEREAARGTLAQIQQAATENGTALTATANAPAQMTFMADALERTAYERDDILADAQAALNAADALEYEIKLMHEQNDQIFRQLEEAMTISVEPLDKMFRSAGMPTDQIIEQVRRGYSGQGGPLTPLSFSTRGGEEPSPDEVRANRLLNQMDQLNLYRIAAQKAPFAVPVKSVFRFTSPYGYRRDPKTGGRRMHKGTDFAAAHGTDIFATADGVVVHAGWQSGFGKLVRIKHAFGIETLYAHSSNLRVTKGQRVSRGDHIADMGSTGRSTGTHLHYEIHVNGRTVNPMIYIKAARNVF
ncbi:MAG: murein DD-endopeptidase MepM/ murein hydrolase activator NlpD [Paracoccaceae bacterium]